MFELYNEDEEEKGEGEEKGGGSGGGGGAGSLETLSYKSVQNTSLKLSIEISQRAAVEDSVNMESRVFEN